MQKQLAVRMILMVSCLVLLSAMLYAQIPLPENPMMLRHGNVENRGLQSVTDQPTTTSAPRGYAHYTAKDWRKLIDSTWGPGLPTDQKLQIFDGFWNDVDQSFGGFPNLNVTWDSLKNLYRPEVAAGVSRGRFAAIMSQMQLSLREPNTYICDLGIDSAMLVAGKWRPRGVPTLFLVDWDVGMGARLTPLPDSTLLVIQANPSQPLGLQPGDVVLGYDGVPWKQLIRQLLDAQLPVGARWYFNSWWPSTPEGWSHNLLTSATANWYLFDTIDVIKYNTGQTVHLPTSKLDVTDWDNIYYFDQIPVKGVPMPKTQGGSTGCSWGVVEGTNVGYIYINSWDQYATLNFSSAVKALTQSSKMDGLIIDFRWVNAGAGTVNLSGLDALFSSDPTSSLYIADRVAGGGRMQFTTRATSSIMTNKHHLYDRPIAVLTGPECYNEGDYGAFLMRAHPMVRFFGKPTAGAYITTGTSKYYIGSLWRSNVSIGEACSNYPGEGYLLHKGFDVDERIWFTKDDAAKGDDTIVKRALQWIGEVAHGHDVTLAKIYGAPGKDTIKVTATVENSLKHTLSVWGYLSDRAGVTIDSCQMFDDGLHNDGASGDKVYGGRLRPPVKESTYDLSLKTTDITAGTFRYITRANAYFTNGPIVNRGWRSSTADTIPNPGDVLRLRFPLVNGGTTDTVKSVTATVTTLDTLILIGSSVQISYGDLVPGVESIGSTTQALKVQPYCPPNAKAKLLLTIVCEGVTVRADTVTLLVQAAATEVEHESAVPREYGLSQNYPNPFNPSTTIQYDLPKSAMVSLTIYNTLGQLVISLVNEQKGPGSYQIQWNALDVPSGIYFYRLQAGQFVETKKMILLR
jgi:hypothetical protein